MVDLSGQELHIGDCIALFSEQGQGEVGAYVQSTDSIENRLFVRTDRGASDAEARRNPAVSDVYSVSFEIVVPQKYKRRLATKKMYAQLLAKIKEFNAVKEQMLVVTKELEESQKTLYHRQHQGHAAFRRRQSVKSDDDPRKLEDLHEAISRLREELGHVKERHANLTEQVDLMRQEYVSLESTASQDARDNEFELARLRGSAVIYGEPIQLRHLFSGKFLSAHNHITSQLEYNNRRANLLAESDASCIFRFMPRYKVRAVGEVVRVGDHILVEIVRAGNSQYLHRSAFPFKTNSRSDDMSADNAAHSATSTGHINDEANAAAPLELDLTEDRIVPVRSQPLGRGSGGGGGGGGSSSISSSGGGGGLLSTGTGDVYEINFSARPYTFTVTLHRTFDRHDAVFGKEGIIKGGDVLRFFHKDLEGFLGADGPSLNMIHGKKLPSSVSTANEPLVYLQRPNKASTESSRQGFYNALAYWQVVFDDHSFSGENLQWLAPVRMRHIQTGLFLALHNNRLTLAPRPDPSDVAACRETVFCFRPVAQLTPNTLEGSDFRLQHVHSGSFVHASVESDSHDHITAGRPRIAHEDSTFADVGVRDQMMYMDVFNVSRVADKELLSVNFILGVLPMFQAYARDHSTPEAIRSISTNKYRAHRALREHAKLTQALGLIREFLIDDENGTSSQMSVSELMMLTSLGSAESSSDVVENLAPPNPLRQDLMRHLGVIDFFLAVMHAPFNINVDEIERLNLQGKSDGTGAYSSDKVIATWAHSDYMFFENDNTTNPIAPADPAAFKPLWITILETLYDAVRANNMGNKLFISSSSRSLAVLNLQIYFMKVDFALAVLKELVLDNRRVLDLLIENGSLDLFFFIQRRHLREGKADYHFLEVLTAFCVCDDLAVRHGQTIVTERLFGSALSDGYSITDADARLIYEIESNDQGAMSLVLNPEAPGFVASGTPLTTLAQGAAGFSDPHMPGVERDSLIAQIQYFTYELKLFEAICRGRHERAIHVVRTRYVNWQRIMWMMHQDAPDDGIPDSMRAMVVKLLVVLEIDVGSNYPEFDVNRPRLLYDWDIDEYPSRVPQFSRLENHTKIPESEVKKLECNYSITGVRCRFFLPVHNFFCGVFAKYYKELKQEQIEKRDTPDQFMFVFAVLDVIRTFVRLGYYYVWSSSPLADGKQDASVAGGRSNWKPLKELVSTIFSVFIPVNKREHQAEMARQEELQARNSITLQSRADVKYQALCIVELLIAYQRRVTLMKYIRDFKRLYAAAPDKLNGLYADLNKALLESGAEACMAEKKGDGSMAMPVSLLKALRLSHDKLRHSHDAVVYLLQASKGLHDFTEYLGFCSDEFRIPDIMEVLVNTSKARNNGNLTVLSLDVLRRHCDRLATLFSSVGEVQLVVVPATRALTRYIFETRATLRQLVSTQMNEREAHELNKVLKQMIQLTMHKGYPLPACQDALMNGHVYLDILSILSKAVDVDDLHHIKAIRDAYKSCFSVLQIICQNNEGNQLRLYEHLDMLLSRESCPAGHTHELVNSLGATVREIFRNNTSLCLQVRYEQLQSFIAILFRFHINRSVTVGDDAQTVATLATSFLECFTAVVTVNGTPIPRNQNLVMQLFTRHEQLLSLLLRDEGLEYGEQRQRLLRVPAVSHLGALPIEAEFHSRLMELLTMCAEGDNRYITSICKKGFGMNLVADILLDSKVPPCIKRIYLRFFVNVYLETGESRSDPLLKRFMASPAPISIIGAVCLPGLQDYAQPSALLLPRTRSQTATDGLDMRTLEVRLFLFDAILPFLTIYYGRYLDLSRAALAREFDERNTMEMARASTLSTADSIALATLPGKVEKMKLAYDPDQLVSDLVVLLKSSKSRLQDEVDTHETMQVSREIMLDDDKDFEIMSECMDIVQTAHRNLSAHAATGPNGGKRGSENFDEAIYDSDRDDTGFDSDEDEPAFTRKASRHDGARRGPRAGGLRRRSNDNEHRPSIGLVAEEASFERGMSTRDQGGNSRRDYTAITQGLERQLNDEVHHSARIMSETLYDRNNAFHHCARVVDMVNANARTVATGASASGLLNAEDNAGDDQADAELIGEINANNSGGRSSTRGGVLRRQWRRLVQLVLRRKLPNCDLVCPYFPHKVLSEQVADSLPRGGEFQTHLHLFLQLPGGYDDSAAPRGEPLPDQVVVDANILVAQLNVSARNLNDRTADPLDVKTLQILRAMVQAERCARPLLTITSATTASDESWARVYAMQCKLNRAGAAIIAAKMVCSTREKVIRQGLLLLNALLDGGNSEVQNTLQRFLDQSREDTFVVRLREEMQNTFSAMRERRDFLMRTRMEMVEHVARRDRLTAVKVEGTTMSKRAAAAAAKAAKEAREQTEAFEYHVRKQIREQVDDTGYMTSLLRFLQLLCEDHHTALQNYMRVQWGNPTSVNLVREAVLSLNDVCSPSAEYPQAMGLAVQVFDTLTEFCQGCQANQRDVFDSGVMDSINFALSYNNYTSAASTLTLLKLAAVKLMSSFLEHSDEFTVQLSEDVLSTLDASMLYDCMNRNYYFAKFKMWQRRTDLGPQGILGENVPSEMMLASECYKVFARLRDINPSTYDETMASEGLVNDFSMYITRVEEQQRRDEARAQGIDLVRDVVEDNSNVIGSADAENTKAAGLIATMHADDAIASTIRSIQEKNDREAKSLIYSKRETFRDDFRLNVEQGITVLEGSEHDTHLVYENYVLNRVNNMLTSLKNQDNVNRWDPKWDRFPFFAMMHASIEFVDGDRQLQKLYFPAPIQDLPKRVRTDLVWGVDRSTPSDKVRDFLKKAEETREKMTHLAALEATLTGRIFERLTSPVNYLKWAFLILTLAVNILMLATWKAAPTGLKPLLPSYYNAVLLGLGIPHLCVTVVLALEYFLRQPESIWRTLTRARSYYYLALIGLSAVSVFTLWGYFFPLFLLHIAVGNSHISGALSSVTTNGSMLRGILLVGIIIVYIFSVFAFGLLRFNFDQEPEILCTTLAECFLSGLSWGLRTESGFGGVVGYIENFTWSDYGWRIIFDMLFFFLITIIWFNLILGVILDTFRSLRSQREKTEAEVLGTCFICSIAGHEFERPGVSDGFRQHRKKEHNMWHYYYLIQYLHVKDRTTFTFYESYLYEKMVEERDAVVFPVQRALSLQHSAVDVHERLHSLSEAVKELTPLVTADPDTRL